MKKHFLPLTFCLLFLLGFSATGTVVHSAVPAPEVKINLKSVEVVGSFIVLQYSIPYQGMMEFRLFDQAGEMVWRNQYVREAGEHQLKLKTAAFSHGSEYACRINYKQHELVERLLIP